MDKQDKKPFYKRWWFITIAIVFVLGLIGSIGGDESQQSLQDTTSKAEKVNVVNDVKEQQKQYVEVFSFSGNGQKKSEPFTISGTRFKIAYDCSGQPDFTLCQAFAYKVGSKLPEGVMNSPEAITDETVIYGSGEYYIDANVIGNFTMTVYDYR